MSTMHILPPVLKPHNSSTPTLASFLATLYYGAGIEIWFISTTGTLLQLTIKAYTYRFRRCEAARKRALEYETT